MSQQPIQRLDSFYDEVKRHPMFEPLSKSAALPLLERCLLRVYEPSNMIFHSEEIREGLLLILDGQAEVFVQGSNNRKEVLEVVQKGEIIGLSSLSELLQQKETSVKMEQLVEVRAFTQVRSIMIPFTVIKEMMNKHEVRDYLLQQVTIRLKHVYSSLAEQIQLSRVYEQPDRVVARVQDVMFSPPVTAGRKTPIQEIAKKMVEHKTSSVLIEENGELWGIVTEKDLVERVISKGIGVELTADIVMTRNPYTISRFDYYYNATSLMLLKGVKHLPVVENNEVVGIVTFADLMRKKNDQIINIIQQIEKAQEENLPKIKEVIYEVFEKMLRDQVPIFHILDVVSKLYDRLAHRCMTLAVNACQALWCQTPKCLTPPTFCWYHMGSAGRREQFLLTDQDHFIVYETPEGMDEDKVNKYYEKLGEKVVKLLEKAGYARCKGKMMASESDWRGSLLWWEERLRSWLVNSTNENLLLAQNFFSYRLVYGDGDLNRKFENKLKEQIARSKIFLYQLASQEKTHPVPTIEHPIRSLFKIDRKQVDMKKEILFPFHHSLQTLSLSHGIVSGTPLERIEQLALMGKISASFAHDIKMSFSQVMQIYVKHKWNQAMNNEQPSSVLHFTHLTTLEKEELILSVKTIRELQSHLITQFQI